jgi:hypothetical protein
VAGIAGAVTLGGGAGKAGSGGGLLSSGPTVEDAKRVCKTAFITEMEQRNQNANAGNDLAVGSLTGIDIDDAQAVGGGFEVDGTAHYDIATSMMNVPGMVSLTCTATPDGHGGLTPAVSNRGAAPTDAAAGGAVTS